MPTNIGGDRGSQVPRVVTYVVIALLSIALYNVIELFVLVFFTFKHRRGLYFWSLLAATAGIASYSVGFILKDFSAGDGIVYFFVTLIAVGWCAMVTGQSMVLFSRLHLIVRRRAVLRMVLAIIIINAIILHTPTIVFVYGANSPEHRRFATGYAVYERIQVTLFFVQELIISGVYLYETLKLLYWGGRFTEIHGEAGRKLMVHLMCVNVTVILLDVAILALQFAGRYTAQTAAKGFIYSVKLKLEFDILNRLICLARRSSEVSNTGEITDGEAQPGGLSHQEQGQINNGSHRHSRRCSCRWIFFASRVKDKVGYSENKARVRSHRIDR